MMSEVTRTPSLRAILFKDEDATKSLGEAFEASGVTRAISAFLGAISSASQSAVGVEVAATVVKALSLGLADVLISGWRKHRALIEAAEQTIAALGARAVVELAGHRIKFVHTLRIDILVDRTKLTDVEVEIGVTADLDVVCGVVAAGRLVTVRSGRAQGAVEVVCLARTLASAPFSIDLPVEIDLGGGIPLVEPSSRSRPDRADSVLDNA